MKTKPEPLPPARGRTLLSLARRQVVLHVDLDDRRPDAAHHVRDGR